jgi:hypothetical protein
MMNVYGVARSIANDELHKILTMSCLYLKTGLRAKIKKIWCHFCHTVPRWLSLSKCQRRRGLR